MTKGGSGKIGTGKGGGKRPTRSLLGEFLDALALEGRSPHSVRSYRRDLEPLLVALPTRLDQVHPADLREHFRAQQQAGRAPSSINHAIAATRSFFNFLVDNRVLDSSPAMSLRSIRVGPSLAPKHLTVEEVDSLLAEPRTDTPTGVRDLALLSFLYNTGLRVGELCALDRSDVQLPADGWGQVQLVGKGMRMRWVPVNAHARHTLEDYLACREDDNPALFLNRSGERFSVRGVALLVNRYLRRVGITDRSGPHLLRHTFATHALRARPNLRAVQELLGHSSVTTTQRYTHMDADDLRQQVADLPGNGFRH
ncbi:MAG TPA: tyrosine-type recombinase/integrase [Armatimonadota bacterium]|nr:tyrosine-type recombinase/integrase [Armatimonadota bacterium]